jgi:phosphoesterase RecJ-like protein
MTSNQTSSGEIISLLRDAKRLFLTTHKDPDGDGIGSILALGRSLSNAGKKVVCLSQDPVPFPVNQLEGADRIVRAIRSRERFDVVLVLDCGDLRRLGVLKPFLKAHPTLVNIDHHESNECFGDLNWVDPKSSSTGEIIFKLIKDAGLPMDSVIAANIFAAIMSDTGSFRYNNTTQEAFRISAEIMDYGVNPWEITTKMMTGYSSSRLKLLEMALGTIEFHCYRRIGMMTVSSEMFAIADAARSESEKFIDYPRYIKDVEIAVLIRQTGDNHYKFSLRSNNHVNVAQLASRFGGGGHAKAAGFEIQGPIELLKNDFLREAVRFFNDEN